MRIEVKEYKPFYNTFIPSDWEVIELGKIGEFKNGINKDKSEFGHGYPFVGLTDIFGVPKVFVDDFSLVNSSKKDRSDFDLKKGDVLFVRSSVKPTGVGLTTLVCEDMPDTTFSGFIIRFREIEKLEFEFKSHCFFESNFRNKLLTKSTISANTNINQASLKSLKLAIPPFQEQKAIAHVLGLMDKAINANNQLVTQKELRKKWLMQNLLTGKKRLKGFDGEWKEYTYFMLLQEVKRNIDWDDNELYRLISVRRRSGGIFYRDALFGSQIRTKNLRNVKKGDFLLSKMQILHGASALATEDFEDSKISGSYIAVIAKDPKILTMEYFSLISKAKFFYHQTYISSYGVHIEKMTFDFKSFLGLGCQLPSVAEQKEIVDFIAAAEQEINLLKAKSDKLKEQKKGMMQILLTGKKRLKID